MTVGRTGDASTAYANNHDFFIYIAHVATGYFTKFKAFLTSFEDSFVCDWNDVNVYGRMDPISTYQGTRRQINFGFDVIANDETEARENFTQSRILIRSLYPVYEETAHGKFSATAMMAPPLLKIRFANLIASGPSGAGLNNALLGKVSGLSYAPDMEAGFFTRNSSAQGGQILPKVHRFSFNFTVFHTEEMGFSHSTNQWRAGGGLLGEQDQFPYSSTNTDVDVNQLYTPSGTRLEEVIDTAEDLVAGAQNAWFGNDQGSSATVQGSSATPLIDGISPASPSPHSRRGAAAAAIGVSGVSVTPDPTDPGAARAAGNALNILNQGST